MLGTACNSQEGVMCPHYIYEFFHNIEFWDFNEVSGILLLTLERKIFSNTSSSTIVPYLCCFPSSFSLQKHSLRHVCTVKLSIFTGYTTWISTFVGVFPVSHCSCICLSTSSCRWRKGGTRTIGPKWHSQWRDNCCEQWPRHRRRIARLQSSCSGKEKASYRSHNLANSH